MATADGILSKYDEGVSKWGSGKVHRYVEIKSENELKDPAIKKLIDEALNAYQKRSKVVSGSG